MNKNWLFRITTNLCLDELCRSKRCLAISLEVYNSEGEEIKSPSWLVDPGQSPEHATVDSVFWKVPLGTVKSRLARGRQMMSEIYQDRTMNWQTNKVQPASIII
jgi:DNA-directed RNA polymerase specialized sigma24 family protein